MLLETFSSSVVIRRRGISKGNNANCCGDKAKDNVFIRILPRQLLPPFYLLPCYGSSVIVVKLHNILPVKAKALSLGIHWGFWSGR